MSSPRPPRDRLELAVGRVLSLGVVASSSCLALGMAAAIAGVGAASRLITAGLIVLMMTPTTRVIVSMIEYFDRRDWLFAGLTTIVLLELAASVIAAMSGSG